MNPRPACIVRVLMLLGGLGSLPALAEAELPVADGRQVLAAVNGEPVTVDAFLRDLATMHAGAMAPDQKRSREEPAELLERLINVRLVLQEARAIGLDELPQTQAAIEAYRKQALRQVLFRRQTEDLQVDPLELEPAYRAVVKEVMVRSVAFGTEVEAQALVEEFAAGADFDLLVDRAVETGQGEEGDPPAFVRPERMLPEVAGAIGGLGEGEIAGPISITDKFAVLQVQQVRYPDDPAMRERVEAELLQGRRAERLRVYLESIKDQHAKIDEALLDDVDFESPEPGFEALLADSRVLVTLDGEPAVRVSDLAEEIKDEFFHGIDRAILAKRINPRKVPLLNKRLIPLVIRHEAARLKLENSEEYRTMVDEFESGVLFGTFVERVVEPEVRLNDAELESYLAEHSDEFSSPEMLAIEGLAFDALETAESALAKLREGVDFAWMKRRAEGQSDPDGAVALLEFPDRLVMTSTLPGGAREAVAGATRGEFRLYSVGEDGPFYVLHVRQAVPPEPKPLEQVKNAVVGRVFDEKRWAKLEEWIERLRAASEIEIFAGPDVLDTVLTKALQSGV